MAVSEIPEQSLVLWARDWIRPGAADDIASLAEFPAQHLQPDIADGLSVAHQQYQPACAATAVRRGMVIGIAGKPVAIARLTVCFK